MTDKKRLLIYLGLTFSLTLLWFFITNPTGETWQDMGQTKTSLVALGMMFPVISNVLTRILTKEGFAFSGDDNSLFGIVLKDGKWIYFLIACFLPWIYTELSNALELLICPSEFDPEYFLSLGIEKRLLPILPVNAIVAGTIGSFAAFGEEGGWRGYMMPKLLRVTGRKRALLTGGVIWGLWHAPLTAIGHNFGTDYPGFPYVGIISMCIFCTLLGILLTFVTEKSGSVWPAAIMHAVSNAGPSILQGYIDPEKGGSFPKSPGWIAMILSLLLIAVPVLIFWDRIPAVRRSSRIPE